MTRGRADRIRLVRAALDLRTDVLRYLGSRDTTPSCAHLRAASPDAWAFLLRAESCALPLAAALRRAGALRELDEPLRTRLASAEASELQRVLAARQLVRDLDVVARDVGVRLTLLKGAAIAARPERQALDLGDVDVLVAPESADAVWTALLQRGWTPHGRGVTPSDDLGARMHFAPLRNGRHALPLELHTSFSYGAPRALAAPLDRVPLDGYAALDRLDGPAALAATLRHSVAAHPHRRGHLRDLFLLADLAQSLGERELAAIDDALAAEELDVEARAMLAQARALGRGAPVDHDPANRAFVVWKYATLARTSPLLAASLPGWLPLTHVPLERRAVRRRAYRRLLGSAAAPVPIESSFGRGGGPVAGAVRALGIPRIGRAAYRVALVICLIAAGAVIRRHVHALDREREG